MTKDHSFDFVCRANLQEVRNAVQMTQKEIVTRFDFRGSRAGVSLEDSPPALMMTADHGAQLRSVEQVVQSKLAKRSVPIKLFAWGEPEELPGGGSKCRVNLQQGLSSEQARTVVRAIKDLKLKVQPRIDGDAVRVSGKQIDDLQTVIKAIMAKDLGFVVQVENYR